MATDPETNGKARDPRQGGAGSGPSEEPAKARARGKPKAAKPRAGAAARAETRSSSSSRPPRPRRSASTSAAAIACGRPSATSAICPRRSSASTSRTASSPTYVTIPGKEKTIAELKNAAKDRAKIFSPPTLIARARRSRGTSRPDHAEARRAACHRACSSTRSRRTRCSAPSQNAGDIDEQEGRGAAGAPRARSSRRLQGEPGALEDREEGPLRRPRADRRASAHRRARARDPRVQAAVEYWTIEALLEKDGQQFTAKLHQIDGKKAEIRNEAEARAILDDLKARKTVRRSPRSSAASAARIRRRRSRPARCSRKRRRSCASAPSARCASRRISTRASRSATRARSVSSPTCVPTRRASPRAPAPQARDICACCSARSIVPEAPQLYGDGKIEERAGRARSDSSHRSDAAPRARCGSI